MPELLQQKGDLTLSMKVCLFVFVLFFATDDTSLLPCPQTLVQVLADRGRFVSDEYCNPSTEYQCDLYHLGAAHCFRTIISR